MGKLLEAYNEFKKKAACLDQKSWESFEDIVRASDHKLDTYEREQDYKASVRRAAAQRNVTFLDG